MAQQKRPRSQRSDPEVPNLDQWFRSSDDVRLGFASGNSFEMKRVTYAAIGGMAIFEGDIALGTVEQLEQIANAAADPETLPAHGVAVTGDRFRWPNGVIPYVIDPGLSDPQRVTEAIAHWMHLTPLRFVAREEDNPLHENYISFEEQDGCWSQVGMQGGKQVVSLGPTCNRGSAIHEIGHVAGLWHEQSRHDRDQYVRVLWENIEEGREHNFDQHISDGDDIGPYDYESVMHYPALAFSRNGQPTIVTKDGQSIGQRLGLSVGDIAAIQAIYGDVHPPQPPTGPRREESGVQRLGTIPAFDTRRWVTQDWSVEWSVLWTIIPSPVSMRVEWHIIVERQSEELLKYYIEVRNLSSQEVTIDARYTIF